MLGLEKTEAHFLKGFGGMGRKFGGGVKALAWKHSNFLGFFAASAVRSFLG